MRAPFSISPLALSVALSLVACPEGSPDESATQATPQTTQTPQTTPATGPDSSDPSTDGTQPTGTGGTTDSDSGGPAAHEICDRYLACMAVVAPAGLPGAQMGFGEDGTCWQGSEAQAQMCLDACAAGLVMYNEAFPEEKQCGLCQEHSECDMDAGELCHQGKCTVTTCGDGVVDGAEVCDSQPGCNPDCQGPTTCNPLTHYPCEDFSCFIEPEDGRDEYTVSICADGFEYALVPEGKPCAYSIPVECAPRLACARPALLPGCDPEGKDGCCTRLCNLNDPTECAAGDVCVPYEDIGPYLLTPELGYVGLCVPA